MTAATPRGLLAPGREVGGPGGDARGGPRHRSSRRDGVVDSESAGPLDAGDRLRGLSWRRRLRLDLGRDLLDLLPLLLLRLDLPARLHRPEPATRDHLGPGLPADRGDGGSAASVLGARGEPPRPPRTSRGRARGASRRRKRAARERGALARQQRSIPGHRGLGAGRDLRDRRARQDALRQSSVARVDRQDARGRDGRPLARGGASRRPRARRRRLVSRRCRRTRAQGHLSTRQPSGRRTLGRRARGRAARRRGRAHRVSRNAGGRHGNPHRGADRATARRHSLGGRFRRPGAAASGRLGERHTRGARSPGRGGWREQDLPSRELQRRGR